MHVGAEKYMDKSNGSGPWLAGYAVARNLNVHSFVYTVC